jgi:hypothetical protein
MEKAMTTFTKITGIAGILVAGLIAANSPTRAANENSGVTEGQVIRTELGNDATAISYWVSQPDGWHVVTTIDSVSGRDTDAEHHAVTRFSATLMPGQEQVISVPFPLGEPQQSLRIRRIGDRIEVARLSETAL